MKEDEALSRYIGESNGIDDSGAWFIAAVPRGWLIAGLCCLAPGAIAGTASTAKRGAPTRRNLTRLQRLPKANSVVCRYRRCDRSRDPDSAPFPIGRRSRESLSHTPPGRLGRTGRTEWLPKWKKSHSATAKMALRPYTLAVLLSRQGERVLLEGPSGGGKSTFASLLSGMRKPDSGLVLISGLDGYTVGIPAMAETSGCVSAVPRQPHPDGNACFQSVDGKKLAAYSQRCGGSAGCLSRIGTGRICSSACLAV